MAGDAAVLWILQGLDFLLGREEERVPRTLGFSQHDGQRGYVADRGIFLERFLQGPEAFVGFFAVERRALRVFDDELERAATPGLVDKIESLANVAALFEIRRQIGIGIKTREADRADRGEDDD